MKAKLRTVSDDAVSLQREVPQISATHLQALCKHPEILSKIVWYWGSAELARYLGSLLFYDTEDKIVLPMSMISALSFLSDEHNSRFPKFSLAPSSIPFKFAF